MLLQTLSIKHKIHWAISCSFELQQNRYLPFRVFNSQNFSAKFK